MVGALGRVLDRHHPVVRPATAHLSEYVGDAVGGQVLRRVAEARQRRDMGEGGRRAQVGDPHRRLQVARAGQDLAVDGAQVLGLEWSGVVLFDPADQARLAAGAKVGASPARPFWRPTSSDTLARWLSRRTISRSSASISRRRSSRLRGFPRRGRGGDSWRPCDSASRLGRGYTPGGVHVAGSTA